MKKIISAILFGFYGTSMAQEVSFQYGAPVTKELVDKDGQNMWYASKQGAELFYSGMVNPVKFLGKFNEHYFLIKTGRVDKVLLIFNEKMVVSDAIPLGELSSVKGSNYLDAIVFSGKICLFFEGISDQVTKGNKGVFLLEFDLETSALSDSKLIDQFPSIGKIDGFDLNTSKNNSYLGITVNASVSAVNYKFSFTVFDKDMNKLQSQKGVEGKFAENHEYRSSFISNAGMFYLLFDDCGTAIMVGPTSNCIPKPHEHITYITYDKEGTRNEIFLTLEGRTMLHMNFIEQADQVGLFVSWYYTDSESKSGFSIYSLRDKTEPVKYEFDAAWVEPFTNRTIYYALEDATTKGGNMFYELKDVIETETSTIYVIKKSVLMKTATSGSSIGGSAESIVTTVDGDILIVKQDKVTKEFTTAKIERYANTSFNSGEAMLNYDGKLHFVYSAFLPKEQQSGAYETAPGNTGIFASTVDLNTLNVSTKVVAGYGKKSVPFEQMLHLYSLYQSGNKFVVYGTSEKIEGLIKGSF